MHTPHNLPKPMIIGVCGGSASGKTNFCKKLIEGLKPYDCSIIHFDSFYKPIPEGTDFTQYNFDAPESLDFELAYDILKKLTNFEEAEVPDWDFKLHGRAKEWQKLPPTDIIFFEGILAFNDKRIMDMLDLKIFVDLDDDIRLARRITRDVKERGRDLEGVIYQYMKFVKPAFEEHIKPKSKLADFTVRGDTWDKVAIQFVLENLRNEIHKREDIRKQNSKLDLDEKQESN